MAWRKLGLIHALEPSPDRAAAHMQGPVAIALADRIRVFFAARDARGKSYPASMDVDRADPLRVIDLRPQRIAPPGATGAFDEDGAMPASAVRAGSDLWLYYTGWNVRMGMPYHNSIGVASSRDDGRSFERMFDGPILDRTASEPFLALAPCVVMDEHGWRMWYVSGLGWHEVAGRPEPLYALKGATSADGIEWRRSGALTLPRRHEREAIGRATVLWRGGRYHMWFCYRDSVDFRGGAGSYRIGYARSDDGETWARLDALAGIDVSAAGWDASMICYPNVIECAGQTVLFYNGNGFGQSGIGCAVWEGPLP